MLYKIQKQVKFRFAFFAVCLLVVAWISASFLLPTFDQDEALYRRMAEEMKLTKFYTVPTWDGRQFLDKPPLLVWAILAASKLVDSSQIAVSIFAARLPGLLFTLATVALLATYWSAFWTSKKLASDEQLGSQILLTPFEKSALFPACLFGMALLPTLAGAGVLYDQLLALSLIPVFFVILNLHLQNRKSFLPEWGFRSPVLQESLVLGAAMGLAVMVKGLVGIVLPCFALFLSALWWNVAVQKKTRAMGHAMLLLVQHFAFSVVVASVLSGIFYTVLYFEGGAQFVRHFFVVEHFGRGLQAREGHSGPLFYHVAVMAMGGGALTGVLFQCLPTLWIFHRQKNKTSKAFVPGRSVAQDFLRANFSWVASIVVFFSIMSTKLPNYTWPAWCGIVFATGLCFVQARHAAQHKHSLSNRASSLERFILVFLRVCAFFAWALPCFLGAVLFLVCLAFQFPWQLLLAARLSAFVPTPQWTWLQPLLLSFPSVPMVFSASLGVLGALFFAGGMTLQSFKSRNLSALAFQEQKISLLAGLNASVLFVLSFGIAPFAQNVAQKPLQNLTARALHGFQIPAEKYATLGINSPTVSSAFGPLGLRQYGKGDTSVFEIDGPEMLLVPVWIASKCTAHQFELVAQEGYAVLCRRLTSSKELPRHGD